MDNNSLAIYMHELKSQTRHVDASFEIFNQALQQQSGNGVLFAGQMVLMSVSQLASILWPSRARSRTRGESLRKVLQLPEKHPINDRRLIELWERSDEKLEEWIATSKGQNVVFDYVGDLAKLENPSDHELQIYRAFDVRSHTYYARGVGFDFPALFKALNDVVQRVNSVYAQMWPEQAKAEAEQNQRMMQQAQQANAAAQPVDGVQPQVVDIPGVTDIPVADIPVDAPKPIDLGEAAAEADTKPAKE